MRFPSTINIASHNQISIPKRLSKFWQKSKSPAVTVGLKNGNHSSGFGILFATFNAQASRRQGDPNFAGMVGVVVHKQDVIVKTPHLKTAASAFKPGNRCSNRRKL